MLKLTGILKTPAGAVLANTTVRFFALANSLTVLQGTTGEFTTTAAGEYTVSLENGYHKVIIQPSNARPVDIGRIFVTANTDATTLNELLLAASAATASNPLADEILAARDRAETAALQAGEQATAAAASLLLAEQAATLAGEKSVEAKDHAEQAGSSAILANQGATHVADNAAAASQSSAKAEAAKEAAELAMTESQAAALATADDASLIVEVGGQVSQLASQVANDTQTATAKALSASESASTAINNTTLTEQHKSSANLSEIAAKDSETASAEQAGIAAAKASEAAAVVVSTRSALVDIASGLARTQTIIVNHHAFS